MIIPSQTLSYKSLECAYSFYENHIRVPVFNKLDTYRLLNIPTNGIVSSRDWEAFAAILVWDRGDGKHGGTDLLKHEVKSSSTSSYEYQYCPVSGVEKYNRDLNVNHVWIHYSNNYQNLSVRVAPSNKVAELMESWYPDILANKKNSTNQFRREIRKNINLTSAERLGRLALWVRNGVRKNVGIEYKFTH